MNRRQLMQTALGGLAAAIPVKVAGEEGSGVLKTVKPKPATANDARSFPKGFVWGTATSAYQIEGAVKEDGRGVSIWDRFAHTPGKIFDGSNADVAVDHYHRYKEDVQLMKAMGTKAYRFSIAWPRIFPEGRGKVNPKGLDFYNRLVDELLANGIEPFPSLYHWDLPQTLQERYGGWESRETALAFADYAGYVTEKLSDRVQRFFTLNEIRTFVDRGHESGILAPGFKLPPARLNQVRHHAILAHGLAVQAIRAKARRGTKVGPAENIFAVVPIIETPEHIKATEIAMRELNAGYLTAMLEGRYTDAYLKAAGADAPKFTSEDLKAIASPIDFVGINIYTPDYYISASNKPPGYQSLPFNKSHPRMVSSWHRLGPETLYWAPRLLQKLWNVKEIYITENGCATSDEVAKDGQVYDSDRIMFLRSYLTQLQRATSEGAPVRGYFLWSLLDNFEWVAGYAQRFGAIYVDYTTLKRTPKLSASFYREVIARNSVM
ncbi:GH1 family beta-glucosidase [Chlorogloeopsis sp. ULAP01]|uniref:GH1 family beta-glucosidase n=1 Tax=Chlorogloeopsis sp. ULAP01 TaxID=3056483 RepID=UPI0025AA3D93|nr:GH1 family beta-glucosidase [Chlorogloeopsis sp. ULAP01]MDM9384746.1 GH1 family beta-glucosidase [Chlorogloeopsis sp. ULAP01]